MEKEGNISSDTIKELEEDSEIENLKKVEAALFLSARFLTLQELVMLTDINPLMLKEIIEKLTERYNKEDTAMEIINKENMWKMDVKKEYVGMINKLATGSAEFSKAEQETLAVIAYKQPVKQSIIVKIRGNKAYEHIKHFTEIGLVQARKMGHTKELRLSDDFFEYFHLQNKGEGEVLDPMHISDDVKEKYEEAEKEVEESEKKPENEEAENEAEEKVEENEAEVNIVEYERKGKENLEQNEENIGEEVEEIIETNIDSLESNSEEKEGDEEKNFEGV